MVHEFPRQFIHNPRLSRSRRASSFLCCTLFHNAKKFERLGTSRESRNAAKKEHKAERRKTETRAIALVVS